MINFDFLQYLKIGGHTVEVIKVKDRLSETGNPHGGTADLKNQKIWIDLAQHREQQESTLIHEILEQIDMLYELGLAHTQITTLQTALYQVLKDNQLHF